MRPNSSQKSHFWNRELNWNWAITRETNQLMEIWDSLRQHCQEFKALMFPGPNTNPSTCKWAENHKKTKTLGLTPHALMKFELLQNPESVPNSKANSPTTAWSKTHLAKCSTIRNPERQSSKRNSCLRKNINRWTRQIKPMLEETRN